MLLAINGSMPGTEQLNMDDLYKAADELQSTQPITTKQVKAIHAVINELGFSDTRYRGVLLSLFGVKTCKELTEQQASFLIETLNKLCLVDIA